MPSFNTTIDLMQLKGARLLSGIDQQHPGRNFICIPVDWSEIKVTENRQQPGIFRANMRINLWPTSEKFRQACIDRRRQRGEDTTDYNPPSHTVELSYSPEFADKAKAAAKARLLREHPEWDSDENTNRDLKNAIYEAVRVRLGSAYVNQPREQRTFSGQAPAAQNYSDYQAPAQDDPFAAQDDEELPF